MDIESILLSKNRDAFDRLMTMFKSLVVKDQRLADEAETTESLSAYEEYCHAYEGNDSILDYVFYRSDLVAAGFTEQQASEYYIYPRKLQTLVMYGDTTAKAFIAKLRQSRVKAYTENNTYYRPFCGLPASAEENILVENMDKSKETDPDKILLHNVKYNIYPKTYNKLYYERTIDEIYKKYDYLYLTFLENPMIPYTIRNKSNFDICYYNKTALNSNELNYFFEAYNTAKNEIVSIDYIDAFQNMYSAYESTMYMFILYYTFNLYCANSLERYAVRDYTDDEVYDVLDSNGLSNLKSLNMTLLKNIVKYLPDIKSFLGTQKIIDIIFDIVADKTLTVKRYYLNKKYKIDNAGNTVIKDSGLYNDSVELVFKEKTIKQGSEASFVSDGEYPYDDIVIQDDTWGGTQGLELSEKQAIKTEMKKALLSANFSSIMTKYIGLSKIVDMYTKLTDATDKLGILYQANEVRGNFMKDDTVIFNGMEIHCLSLYAAWCLIYGTLNGATDPDYIIKNQSTLEGIMKLRKNSSIAQDANSLGEISIDLGNGYSRQLKDYFTDEELSKLLVGYNYDSTTPIQDIIAQYDDNYEIIKAIKSKLEDKSKFEEYEIWNTIYEANMTSVNINSLFAGYDTYSSFIRQNDSDFYKYIEALSINSTTREELVKICTSLKNTYASYIKDVSNGSVELIIDENDASGDQSLGDIAELFNQFTSCYTQLYSQDFHVGYDDPGENSLILLYAQMVEKFISSESEFLELTQKLWHDTTFASDVAGYLELSHHISDLLKSENYDEIVVEMELLRALMKESANDYLEFIYKTQKSLFKNSNSDELELVDVIKFKEL